RRRLQRRGSERRPSCHNAGGTAALNVQMDVTKGESDLQHQRDQRPHRAPPLIATSPAHPTTPPTTHPPPLHANVTPLHHARGSLLRLLNQHVSARVNSRRLLRIMSI